MRIGLDVGSTTIKCVVLDDGDNIIYSSYERHYSQIAEKTEEILDRVMPLTGDRARLAISGSAGMGIADGCGIPFVQEVYATRVATNELIPDTDVIVELGGEDAKILFISDTMEVRMNGSCAGGTGAFIDQMATLLHVSADELNDLAAEHEKVYTIASRCGVFAKSDIQPLLNQGAKKSDIAASIFYAVANQTVAGLAQGRPIKGNVVYLGGPLTFLPQLRLAFDDTLKLKGECPENSLYFVAMGAAFCAPKTETDLNEAVAAVKSGRFKAKYDCIEPLFKDDAEYEEFVARHKKDTVARGELKGYNGTVFLGIDAGSTTLKTVVCGENGEILHSTYNSNSGNPVPLIKDFLVKLYEEYPDIKIGGAAVTGYGEELIKSAFNLDFGMVETVAHFTAARQFMPDVEFIIDIGGQDIKCFKIRNGAIDNIYLNEACSSGCGSFLQTFANALNYDIEEFAKLGLKSRSPVDLGSRCTVFMNSSVKQAQKDGATTEDISAGLSISVVKNAIYKVIRPSGKHELGTRIVVQGGTFLNEAVLRAFEKELDVNVVRPDIAGLMGAYGAALYAASQGLEQSGILNADDLRQFTHTAKAASCGGCANNCQLTVNTFSGGRRFISGNRCSKPLAQKSTDESLDLYGYKLRLLTSLPVSKGARGKIGIPMGLNMYELLPFWHAFFTRLGFEVISSPPSDKKLYLMGQNTIPSDTVCFPAKLMHGHVMYLINQGVDTIFYPCMTYNLDERLGDNNYNCPVVAYYPEVLPANMPYLEGVRFINDYVGLHKRHHLPKKLWAILSRYYDGITLSEVKAACDDAYAARDKYLSDIRAEGERIISRARELNMPIIVLAGRPYHNDPEINHGIDKLILGLGAAVITEDSVSDRVEKFRTGVLNQWTYHSRLYAAAKYVCTQDDMNLVQLVSFGCGVDAITTDEVRAILEHSDKIYTQIKIDEITNLGAVKIRLRSLFAAIEQKKAIERRNAAQRKEAM